MFKKMGMSVLLAVMVSSVNSAEPLTVKNETAIPEAPVEKVVMQDAVDEAEAVLIETQPVDEMAMVDAQIRSSFAVTLPTLTLDSIADTPVKGLYEAAFGTRIVYVSGDGRYIVQGDMIDLEKRNEITKNRKNVLRKAVVEGLDESKMIVYGDKDAKDTITVFTDLDCGYCRKLHSEMDQYIEQGIRVRYLAWPRAGIPSQAATDITSVWCADDPKKAMNIAKSGGAIESRNCENPVASHYNLGTRLGINGTPALLLDSGEIIPGYVPAKRLRGELDKRALVN